MHFSDVQFTANNLSKRDYLNNKKANSSQHLDYIELIMDTLMKNKTIIFEM